MSKDKSSSTSIWDDFSEKIESLRDALNTSVDEDNSSGKESTESDLISHFSDNNPVSLGTFDIEALRAVLNTPIDDIIESGQLPEESKVLFEKGSNDVEDSGPSDDKDTAVDEASQLNSHEAVMEIVEENDTADNEDLKDTATLNIQIKETDESDEVDEKQNIHDMEEVTVTESETYLDDLVDSYIQTQEADESDELDETQDIQDKKEVTGNENETDLVTLVEPDAQIPQTDESDELGATQENQVIGEVADTKNENGIEDFVKQDIQTTQEHKTNKNDDEPVSHDVEIKIHTKQSIKNEKIDNYWKQGEMPNPYIQKVDESREKLNKSLEMARELVNRQTEESPKLETPKQEKKRFQFGFTRGEKNGNHKSGTVKEKASKKSNQLKPMVYEMLEPKQDNVSDQADYNHNDNQESPAKQPTQEYQESQAKQAGQTSQVKQDKGHKVKTKQSSDRAKSDEEREILNHRNRLEKSRSLGVPVFVKKPVNLEQIRQLKSMLTSQNDVRILVDTGSSQGRLLVVSGQDPDTLLNTLSQLSIVKTTAVEDETINITV